MYILFFVFFLSILYYYSDFVLSYTNLAKNFFSKLSQRIALNLIFGLSSLLLFSHLLAFLIHDFQLSSRIIFGIFTSILIYCLYKNKKINKVTIDKSELLIIALAIIVALSCASREHFGDSAHTHIAWAGSLITNKIYPPVLPINPNLSLNSHSYGTDLFIGILISITGALPWDAIGLHVFESTLLIFLSLFTLLSYFAKSNLQNLFMTLFVFFYRSETSLIFFYKYLHKILPLGAWLKAWQEASLTSTFDLAYFPVISSENLSLAALILILYLFFQNSEKLDLRQLVVILFLSFSSYFCCSIWWYLLVGAFLLYYLIASIQGRFKLWQSLIPISFGLGKFLTFNGDASSINGISSLIFKPSLFWEHYNLGFLNYFNFLQEKSKIQILQDYVSGQNAFNVHLFSWISFINVALLLMLASLIFFTKAQNKTKLFYYAAFPGFIFPFLFDYILRPSELYKFSSFSKLMLLIFIVINLTDWLYRQLSKNKLLKFFTTYNLILLCLPAIFAINPLLDNFDPQDGAFLDQKEKSCLKAMMKYREANSTALTTINYNSFSDITNIAGFYGVGGQFYKPDQITRQTGIYLLNPLLLTELGVNYILIDVEKDRLAPFALDRLNNQNLFLEIAEINHIKPEWKFYKFIGRNLNYRSDQLAQLQREYLWVLGSKVIGNNFVPIMQFNNYVSGPTRNNLTKVQDIARRDLMNSGQIAAATWLSPQAMAKW